MDSQMAEYLTNGFIHSRNPPRSNVQTDLYNIATLGREAQGNPMYIMASSGRQRPPERVESMPIHGRHQTSRYSFHQQNRVNCSSSFVQPLLGPMNSDPVLNAMLYQNLNHPLSLGSGILYPPILSSDAPYVDESSHEVSSVNFQREPTFPVTHNPSLRPSDSLFHMSSDMSSIAVDSISCQRGPNPPERGDQSYRGGSKKLKSPNSPHKNDAMRSSPSNTNSKAAGRSASKAHLDRILPIYNALVQESSNNSSARWSQSFNENIKKFSLAVSCVVQQGTSMVRSMISQRPFCLACTEATYPVKFLNGDVYTELSDILVHDIGLFMYDKDACRFIIEMMKSHPETCAQIVHYIEDNLPSIIVDKTGSLAVQRIISILDAGQIHQIAYKLIENCNLVINDPYANYVITKLINATIKNHNSDEELRNFIIRGLADEILPNLDALCNGKYSSPVIETIIKHGSRDVREDIELFLLDGGTSSARVERYMSLEFANYIVQTSCDHAINPHHYELFVQGITGALTNFPNSNIRASNRSANREAYIAKMLRKYNVNISGESSSPSSTKPMKDEADVPLLQCQ